MLQTAPSQLMTLEEFLDSYPDGYGKFELRNGVAIEMQPTGTHEQVASFLALKLGIQIDSKSMPYFIARQCIVKSRDSDKSGFNPDITIIDKRGLDREPLWKRRSTITQGTTIPLVVEIVSTNWQDDYLVKLGEYEKIGIAEYWIVDYLGLGGRRYIGNPKQPTLHVCTLVDGEYMINPFQGETPIQSPAFPDLNLTIGQICSAGQ